MNIRVIVGGKASDGSNTLCAVTVECTQDQYDLGHHYEAAVEAVQVDMPETRDDTFTVDENEQPDAFKCWDFLPATHYDISQ